MGAERGTRATPSLARPRLAKPRLPRLAALVITGLALVVVGCGAPVSSGGGPGKSAPAPALGPGGGLVGGAGFAEGSALLGRSDAQLAQELDGIAATGATYLRVDFYWAGAEPTNGNFYWGEIERVVNAARARNLKVLAMLAYTPAWARPAPRSSTSHRWE